MLQPIIFYTMSGILGFAALMVILSRNSVHAALFLVLAFFSSAALWLLAQAEFLAITLVLVYVGAVMVLFLFVVMMINIHVAGKEEGFTRYFPVSLLVAVLAGFEMIMLIAQTLYAEVEINPSDGEGSNIAAIGKLLYTEYVYAFELAAVVLLVAIVAAISLTFRGRRRNTKGQYPSEQVLVKKHQRVRLVSMKAEKGDS